MRSDEYRRLHTICVAMAEQSNVPGLRARWSALAEACEDLATGLNANHRGKDCSKSITVSLTSRRATALHAA
jgi:hypothetical protein